MTWSYKSNESSGRLAVGLTTVAAFIAVSMGVITLALTGAPNTTAHSRGSRETRPQIARSARLDASSWETVRNVVRLRTMALVPGRTAMYRSFAAYMGLSGLLQLHPVLPGRCAIAVSYLYDNMLDLHGAYPDEDWRPLRRLIKQQSSLSVCAPKPTLRLTYIS